MGNDGLSRRENSVLAPFEPEPGEATKPQARLHLVPPQPIMTFAGAAAYHRAQVMRALKEEGTTNTDWLKRANGSRNIGTHTLRPLAHMGESFIQEHPEPHPKTSLAENTPADVRTREIQELQEWVRNFPDSLEIK